MPATQKSSGTRAEKPTSQKDMKPKQTGKLKSGNGKSTHGRQQAADMESNEARDAEAKRPKKRS